MPEFTCPFNHEPNSQCKDEACCYSCKHAFRQGDEFPCRVCPSLFGSMHQKCRYKKDNNYPKEEYDASD